MDKMESLVLPVNYASPVSRLHLPIKMLCFPVTFCENQKRLPSFKKLDSSLRAFDTLLRMCGNLISVDVCEENPFLSTL